MGIYFWTNTFIALCHAPPQLCLFLDESCSWSEKLFTDINLPPLMPNEDNNFSGPLGLDFRKWWHHVLPKNRYDVLSNWTSRRTIKVIVHVISNRPRALRSSVRRSSRDFHYYSRDHFLNCTLPRPITVTNNRVFLSRGTKLVLRISNFQGATISR